MQVQQIVAVTGAESGIGLACVQAFAAAGAKVALLHFAKTDAMAAAVAAAGGNALAIQVDVRSEVSVEAGFAAAEAAFGPANVLVNSAGLNQSGVTVADMALAQWERLIATDLTGAFLTSRRFVRSLHTVEAGGAIVNISSIHADDVRAGAADYCAAKAGMKRLTETMALEEAKAGIRVNAIAPGMILTPMNERALDDAAYRKSLEANVPVGRAGTPEEVAG
ncbi:MAG: SDR family oxidoreductase, partial [Sphingomonadaceae bacterium]|nr:SDR family oxidoreductase [Sphingomonadaceae bacterium]